MKAGKYVVNGKVKNAVKKAFWRAEEYNRVGAPEIARISAKNELIMLAKREFVRTECERIERERGRRFNPVERFFAARKIARELRKNPAREKKEAVGKIIDELMKIGGIGRK